MKHTTVRAVAFVWLAVAGLVATSQDVTAKPEDGADNARAEIAAAAQSYLSAYNSRDVAKLVSHWSPDGVYISRTSGDQVVGREAMTEEFTSVFADGNAPKLTATTESIDFVSPNVAVEHGTATVTRSEGDLIETNYSIVYVKRDGVWLIDRVTEDEILVQSSHYEQLKNLEWLVGSWVDAGDDGVTIELNCQWTKNQNYLSRTYTVVNQQEVESTGLQIIGWDPKEKEVRSWLFDSNGGFIRGTWNQRGDRWIVQSVATLADGATGSFTSVFRPTEDGNYSWQKINQVVAGEILPNLDEVIVRRK
ncbi:YybH family protein [Novipirellula artificiosorum]|uniref:SnoaL-like domain protein n=1 Tax=Novipirellula artificiosorum TaxID=2528016 RepID=A0A5C6DX25_9BACT|nr:SgcJ/EcaC family oxidoreductase [Novipirellula artificiosorum]TWU40945.1 SnoaL-like domain protein [Novipirellula artificiosorum]